MKNLIADVSRRMERIRKAARKRRGRPAQPQPDRARQRGPLMAWDWDAYFNSGSRRGPVPREQVTSSRAPHLRLVRQMNWDAYFGSGRTPVPTPRSEAARRASARPT